MQPSEYPAYLEDISLDNVHWELTSDSDVVLRQPGKWLLFPTAGQAPVIWNEIATLTRNGDLGFGSKYKDSDRPAIMVYTCDADNMEDRNRVKSVIEQALRDAGANPNICHSYKSDVETQRGIYSFNAPGLGPNTPVCKFYGRTASGCTSGNSCRFKHIEPSLAAGRGGPAYASADDLADVRGRPFAVSSGTRDHGHPNLHGAPHGGPRLSGPGSMGHGGATAGQHGLGSGAGRR